jgi:hypothetical protein
MAATVYGEAIAGRKQTLALYQWQPQVWRGERWPPTKHPFNVETSFKLVGVAFCSF